MHGGREFLPSNVHAHFGDWVYFQMFAQIIVGVYLRLHLDKGIHKRVRPVIRIVHSINGKTFPVVAWTQMLFGGITALGFCQGDHLGQCLAHFIMGSAFIAYGILLTIAMLVGQLWIRRTGRSQEFFDSVVIAAWGCVNTFTEHRWGTAWVKNDWQHTTMGVVWWCAGLAGIWLSKDRLGRPKRNFIPGFVIAITGWAMSAHPQDLMISAMTHKAFGYTLMAAGFTRMIEVSFVLQDKVGISDDGYDVHSFQYIPVFVSPTLLLSAACPPLPNPRLTLRVFPTSFCTRPASCSWAPRKSRCSSSTRPESTMSPTSSSSTVLPSSSSSSPTCSCTSTIAVST